MKRRFIVPTERRKCEAYECPNGEADCARVEYCADDWRWYCADCAEAEDKTIYGGTEGL